MSKPREWWIGQVASKAMGIWEAWDTPPQQGTEDFYIHVRSVDEYDRIWRPEDEDYRVPTREDAESNGYVLSWNGIRWKVTWFEMAAIMEHTWRRMPRGPEE